MFDQKVALITGAASGIGRALAASLAAKGGRLLLCDRDETGLQSALEELREATLHAMPVDVTQPGSIEEFKELINSNKWPIDLLINCAGATIAAKPFTESTPEEWDWILDLNVKGTLNCIRAFLPLMQDNGGTIVNLSSMLGLAGMTNQAAYSTTKFAIRGLSESLRMELADSGINVLSVHPGAVRTNFVRNSWADEENKALVQSYIDKMGAVSAEMAAEKILRAVSRRKGRVLIGKDARRIDLLVRLLPSKYTGVILSQIKKRLQ